MYLSTIKNLPETTLKKIALLKYLKADIFVLLNIYAVQSTINSEDEIRVNYKDCIYENISHFVEDVADTGVYEVCMGNGEPIKAFRVLKDYEAEALWLHYISIQASKARDLISAEIYEYCDFDTVKWEEDYKCAHSMKDDLGAVAVTVIGEREYYIFNAIRPDDILENFDTELKQKVAQCTEQEIKDILTGLKHINIYALTKDELQNFKTFLLSIDVKLLSQHILSIKEQYMNNITGKLKEFLQEFNFI